MCDDDHRRPSGCGAPPIHLRALGMGSVLLSFLVVVVLLLLLKTVGIKRVQIARYETKWASCSACLDNELKKHDNRAAMVGG